MKTLSLCGHRDAPNLLSLPTGGRWPLPCPSFGCVAALLNAVVGRRLDRIPKDLALARTPRFLVHPNVFTRSGVMFRSTLHPQGLPIAIQQISGQTTCKQGPREVGPA